MKNFSLTLKYRGDHGFKKDPVPSSGKELFPRPQRFAVTADFDRFAKNHCGATLVTNLAVYASARGLDCLLHGDVQQTFLRIHSFVGNGPVFCLRRSVEWYFGGRGLLVRTTPISRKKQTALKAICSSIDQGNPCVLLVAPAPLAFHWVLALGYTERNGEVFLKIADNWHPSELMLYRPGCGSLLICAFSVHFS